MMRNPAAGPVVDPDLVWWRSRGPVSARREPAQPEVVRRRVREEDEHVHRYMVALEGGGSPIPGSIFGDLTSTMIL